MFGLTKSRATIYGVSGIVLTSALISVITPAREKWLMAQVPPAAPAPVTPVPFVAPIAPVPVAPLVPAAPDPFTAPSQVGVPAVPSGLAPKTRTRPTPPTRRIPIEPVPMPGDVRPPLPALPATPDIRTMPNSDASVLSGIAGKVIITPICSFTAPATSCVARPYAGPIKIYTAARDRVYRTFADDQGAFRLRLLPGQYVVEPDSPNFPIGTTQTFSVISSVVRQMEFNFQTATPPTSPR